MSNLKKIEFAPLQLPPGRDPAEWYGIDGHIFFTNGQDYWFPYISKREGRTEEELLTMANAYLAAKAEEMYPYTPSTATPLIDSVVASAVDADEA